MSFSEVFPAHERPHEDPEWEAEKLSAKEKCRAERENLTHEIRTEVVAGPFKSPEEQAEAQATLDFAYAKQYLTPGDPHQYQREIIICIQELFFQYGELSAIPPEEIQPFLRNQTEQKQDVEVKEEEVERKETNQSLHALRDKFPDLKGAELVDAMSGALDPEAPGYAARLNVLMTIKLLLASEATAPRMNAILDQGHGLDVPTLQTLATDFLAADDVTEEQKSELRMRLGLIENAEKSVGKIPSDPRDLEKQLTERGTRTIQKEITHPDGTKEIVTETERNLEPIVYANNGMPIEFRPSISNPKEWEVSAWRPSGPPLKFCVSTEQLSRGLSSMNWLLATQALEAAGFTYPFGGGVSAEEIGHMETEYTIFSRGLGIEPAAGEMFTEAHTKKALHWMQAMHIKGDYAQEDVNTDWKTNAGKLGVYNLDKGTWDLRALQYLRVRMDAELATTGAPKFENLQKIMNEGGFGEKVGKED